MLLYYIIISIVLFILVLHGYSKVKYKFWVSQPVFYRYNLLNWCRLHTILSNEKPTGSIHLNFLNNNVSYVTNTNVATQVGNIYVNEMEKSIKYCEDILVLINSYPYFNKKYNNGNMKFLDINRKMDRSLLKILLENHDYNPIITINYKNIYKSDNDTSNVISVNSVVGVIISIPLYCFFKNKKANNQVNKVSNKMSSSMVNAMPIYYSQIYYNSQEIDERHVTEMIQTYNYKMFHDWDEVLKRERDFIQPEKHETQEIREINEKSDKVNIESKLLTNQNPYIENGLKIVKSKEKIYTSIFKYTGINIPKLIVPFVEYHSFYIPIINWNKIEYRFHPSIQLIKIGTQNINIFLDYLQLYHTNNDTDNGKYKLFDVSIIPSFSHIFHLIKSEMYSIYILLQKNNAGISSANNDIMLAVYMFRRSNNTIVDKNMKIGTNSITHIPTCIQIPHTNDNFFICGFINALKMEKKGSDIGCVSIDTLSHNKKIIDYFLINNKPILVEKHTLLFYNYICKTLLPENVVIMS